MLKLIVPGDEYINEETMEFFTQGDFELELEHSLISLSKWESMTNKAFLAREAKTPAEIRLYIECMILNPTYPKDAVARMSKENLDAINAYIESSQSATEFGDMPETKGRGEKVTSELIYYWMVAYNIPFECEIWHLNRLFALVRICNMKNSKPKPVSKRQLAERYHKLNAERRAKTGSKG